MPSPKRRSVYARFGKRILDICISATALVLLAPIGLLLAILVRFKMGSPVLFRQRRPGLDGKVFLMFKFRSMTDAIGKDGKPLPDSQRLTSFGAFLRKSSLDELPELFNVLRGEMSLVGPRPLLVEYLELYDATQARRHEVRPGITGWAQINGRNTILFSERIQRDVWYVDHLGFWLDLKILVLTIPKALFSRNVQVVEQDDEIFDLGAAPVNPTAPERKDP